MRRLFGAAAAVVVLVLVLVLVTTAVVGAEVGSQRWDLDSDAHSVGGGHLLMEKQGTGSPNGSVAILEDSEQIWLTTDDAEIDPVTFPIDGGWVVTLVTGEDWGSAYAIAVGKYDPDASTFTAFDTSSVTEISYTGFVLVVNVLNTAASVPINDYLAVRIGNTHGSDTHTVTTAGGSFLASPITDPAYPVPEMAAGVLLGFGLLGLGGYVVVRRRRSRLAAGR